MFQTENCSLLGGLSGISPALDEYNSQDILLELIVRSFFNNELKLHFIFNKILGCVTLNPFAQLICDL